MNTHKQSPLLAIYLAIYVLLSSLGIRVPTAAPSKQIDMAIMGCCDAAALSMGDMAACGRDCCIAPPAGYWLTHWVGNSTELEDAPAQYACLARVVLGFVPTPRGYVLGYRVGHTLVPPPRPPRDILKQICCYRC